MTFWMIARNPTGPGSITAPTRRYGTRDDAVADARKLAAQTGHAFVVGTFDTVIRPTDPATPDLFGKDT